MRKQIRLGLFAIGLMLLGYTASGLVHERPLLTKAASADGVVVDLRPAGGGNPTPVIRFAAGNGSTIDWAGPDTGLLRRVGLGGYAVGEHVAVLYMPDAPGMAVIGSLWSILGRFMLTTLVGVVCILLGVSATRSLRRGRTV